MSSRYFQLGLSAKPATIIAVFLQIVDPADMIAFREKLFDKEHPAVGRVNRDLKLNITVKDQTLGLDAAYTVAGRLEKVYTGKELALLSRAVHKVAFESVAWQIFVGGGLQNPPDLFSDAFDPVRALGARRTATWISPPCPAPTKSDNFS